MAAAEKRLTVDGLELCLLRSKRKTLGLELGPAGVKARAPLRMSERDIIAFVRQKRQWIDTHLQRLPPPRSLEPIALKSGAVVQLRGQPYVLEVQLGSRSPVQVFQGKLVVPVVQSQRPIEQTVQAKLVRWYKEIARHELQTRARYYAQLMDVPLRRADQIYVRDYKRRWGSCDSQGKLSFNWRILQAPTEVSDYVVVHELAHCHEFNHSKRFWSIVVKQMPGYQEQEQWLSDNGYGLYRF